MVRLRPPGEGERLCTPWVLLSVLEFLGIVAFENFWAILAVSCREGVGIDLRVVSYACGARQCSHSPCGDVY